MHETLLCFCCVQFNAMFGGVTADGDEGCSETLMTAFCLRVYTANAYLKIYNQ